MKSYVIYSEPVVTISIPAYGKHIGKRTYYSGGCSFTYDSSYIGSKRMRTYLEYFFCINTEKP